MSRNLVAGGNARELAKSQGTVWEKSQIVVYCLRAVVGGPAMAWPLFLSQKFILVFFAF